MEIKILATARKLPNTTMVFLKAVLCIIFKNFFTIKMIAENFWTRCFLKFFDKNFAVL